MQDTIQADLKSAMLAGDALKVEVLKGLKSSIQNHRIATKKEPSDEAIIKLTKKEVKKRHEAASLYQQAGATERQQKELSEVKILEKYLPKQLSDEELREIIGKILEENKIDSPQKLGAGIGLANKQVGASADGAKIAQIVKEKLGV